MLVLNINHLVFRRDQIFRLCRKEAAVVNFFLYNFFLNEVHIDQQFFYTLSYLRIQPTKQYGLKL